MVFARPPGCHDSDHHCGHGHIAAGALESVAGAGQSRPKFPKPQARTIDSISKSL